MTPVETRADQQAARLEAAIEAGRELLRDLNSAGKDLRRTIREARDLGRAIGETEVHDRMQVEVAGAVARLAEVLEKRMDEASRRVISEFDRLGAILLGVDRAEPLEEMVRQVAAAPGRSRIEAVRAEHGIDVDVLDVHGGGR